MKKPVTFVFTVFGVVLAACAIWQGLEFWSTYYYFSRIERIHEQGLPKISVENGNTIYCRMKADDFRFSLPRGSHAMSPVITSGGFDTVDGWVEARFDGANSISPREYESWLSKRLQAGASVTAASVPGGLWIEFHYFGDK